MKLIVQNLLLKYWWIVLILTCLPHTIYSVRYSIFSLVHDDKAAVISELAHAKISQSSVTYVILPKKNSSQYTNVFGCSFFLMEEMWRDCKTIYLGKTTRVLNEDQKKELIDMLRDLTAKPCDSLKIVGAGTAFGFKELLGCGAASSEVVLTLAYAYNGQLQFLTKLKGAIK